MKKFVISTLVSGLIVCGTNSAFAAEEAPPAPKPVKPTSVKFSKQKVTTKISGFKMDGICLNEYAGYQMCRTKKGIKNITFDGKTDDKNVWVKPVTINTSGYFTTCYSWEWEKFNSAEDTLTTKTLVKTDCNESHPVACCKQSK